MTSDQRSADAVGDVKSRPETLDEAAAARLERPPLGDVALPASTLLDDVPLLGPTADLPISVPVDYPDYHEYDHEQARAQRRERARAQQRLARLRLYSYFMTLAACVFALMTFMYLVQGQGDRDATFLSLGAMFGAVTVFLLWAAVRVTHVGEPDHPF